MKKPKLDETSIITELSGSAFFRGRTPIQSDSKQNLGTKETSNLGTLESRKEERVGFDLANQAYKNDTFSFTSDELDALEDAKISLKRKLDIKSSKNEIIRAALHSLLDNYQKNGEASELVKRIREKRR